MKSITFPFEILFLALILALSVAGFWQVYFAQHATPNFYHYLHVITSLGWLLLLLIQLCMVQRRQMRWHKRIGQSIWFVGPLLIATLALLSVHSASKSFAAGRADPFIVNNVGVTLEIGLLIILAFAMLRRPLVHGALLLSTALLFGGIALFFTLVSFAPPFRIEGPETFYRFGTAALTAQAALIVVTLLLFYKSRSHGWPYLLVAGFAVCNAIIARLLDAGGWMFSVTELVASLSPSISFILAFLIMFASVWFAKSKGSVSTVLGMKAQAKRN